MSLFRRGRGRDREDASREPEFEPIARGNLGDVLSGVSGATPAHPTWEQPIAGVETTPPDAVGIGGNESDGNPFDVRTELPLGDRSPAVPAVPTDSRFRRVPFRPDTVVDGWQLDGVAVRAASVRGDLHRFNGAPRQDDVLIAEFDGRVIVLVADGVSSALHSHLGASAATRYGAQWLESQRGTALEDLDLSNLFDNVAYGLVSTCRTMHQMNDDDQELASREFATTLVVAVVERDVDRWDHWVGRLAAVGDSGAWVLTQDGRFVALTEGKNADGIASNVTASLPLDGASRGTAPIDIAPGQVLLLGSDGFGDPLGDGRGIVGDVFRELFGQGLPRPLAVAHALDFSRERFDDDRTLAAVIPLPTDHEWSAH